MSYVFRGMGETSQHVESMAKSIEHKTQEATNELLDLSYFMKKSLLYIAIIVSLSLYTSIVCKKP